MAILRKEEDQVDTTTPAKRRMRPMSEQLLGRASPKAIHEDGEGKSYLLITQLNCLKIYYFLGVLSILSAATNDLALLINTLDLQATPSTPDMTPRMPSSTTSQAECASVTPRNPEVESPLKKTQTKVSSLAPLRPYAQSRGYGVSKSPQSNVIVSSDRESMQQPHADLIGQPIAPWLVLIAAVFPAKKEKPAHTEPTKAMSPAKIFKPGHNV